MRMLDFLRQIGKIVLETLKLGVWCLCLGRLFWGLLVYARLHVVLERDTKWPVGPKRWEKMSSVVSFCKEKNCKGKNKAEENSSYLGRDRVHICRRKTIREGNNTES